MSETRIFRTETRTRREIGTSRETENETRREIVLNVLLSKIIHSDAQRERRSGGQTDKTDKTYNTEFYLGLFMDRVQFERLLFKPS